MAVCDEPADHIDAACIKTEESVCSKTCDPAGPASIQCTGYCRCEPVCGGRCKTKCCKLAFNRNPPSCAVDQGDCLHDHVFYEHSECAPHGQCVCSPGFCGFEVTPHSEQLCKPGRAAPCMACPRGSFKPSPGTDACTPCPPGTSTRSEASSSAAACEPQCANGSFSATGVVPCQPCPPGTYQDAPGRTACRLCPRGSNFSAAAAGLTRVEDCCAACAAEPDRAAALRPTSPAAAAAAAAAALLPLLAGSGRRRL